jgi:hypothetical protein
MLLLVVVLVLMAVVVYGWSYRRYRAGRRYLDKVGKLWDLEREPSETNREFRARIDECVRTRRP